MAAFTEVEVREILPAWEEFKLCRGLKCTWAELQEMPAKTVEMWRCFLNGEARAIRDQKKT